MIRLVRRRSGTSRSRIALPPLRNIALVIVGGGIGALARVAISEAFPASEGLWPWTTLLENISGAFLLAVLLTVLTERVVARPWSRPLLGTGALGAYTTFSTLAYEIERLGAHGKMAMAAGYAAVSVVGGLAAALAGIMLVRWRAGWADAPR